ncbi:MAG: WS/DGAT/MGAT family O-acyltransferase [Acidimicrobiales bacterium]
MKRLSGLDATFLYLETPTCHMHVCGLAVYDPSEAPGGWSFEKVKEVYTSRLHLAPPFRQRIVEVPLGLHHPLWIEDPDFDIDQHMHQVTAPAPGGPRELAELAAHLVTIQLDRSRPLWEMWIIDGLEHGHVAVLSKLHHATIDGESGTELTVATLDLTPEIAVHEPETEWVPDHVPNEVELLGYATNSLVRQPVRVAKSLQRSLSAGLDLRRRNRRPEAKPPPAPFAAPRTSFNRALTRNRSFAPVTLSLSEAKQVKRAFGTTLNDVILALCSGALRHYLLERGEEPDAPLVAMVPISVRTPEQNGEMGNQVTSALASLATDLDDPAERLQTIAAGTREVKSQQEVIGATTLQDWAEFAAPAVFARAARLYSRTRMADRHRPIFNLTISNVPGPPFPLYLAGAQMVHNYPMGPIYDGGGLNITVMSYLDNLDFGVVACPELVDDVWTIADGLRTSLDELLALVPEPESEPDTIDLGAQPEHSQS